jgi:hypothetical protein
VTVKLALLLGLAAGVFNGLLGRWWLRRSLGASEPAFLAAFGGGMLYRLLFLLGSVWLLRGERYIIIISFIAPLIGAQLLLGAVPLKKKNGT